MSDVHDSRTRSFNMSRIKGTDTKPEMIVRKYLHHRGFRFRLHAKDLPGKPDLVLPKYSSVIFVNGCFWHGHEGCKYFVIPKTRPEWWLEKIQKTRLRDEQSKVDLQRINWRVFVIWECELKGENTDQTLQNLAKEISEMRNGFT